MVKNLSANAGDSGSIPVSGRCSGEGNGNLLRYSCQGNSMNKGAWQATVHRVAKEMIYPLNNILSLSTYGLERLRDLFKVTKK